MLGRAVVVCLLLSLGSSGAAYAQGESVANGKYIAANAGFEIQFPIGWNSTAVNEKYAIVDPADAESDGVPSAVMTVLVVDRFQIGGLMTSEIGVDSGQVTIYEDEACDSLVDEIVSLNGNRVFHTIHECSDEDGYSKTDTYVIFTLTKSIAVTLSAASAEAYDRHAAAFESSLETITIDEPIDFRVALEIILGTTNIFSQDIVVEAAGGPVKLTAATSSRISSIDFDEESKRIAVTVDEQKRKEGHLLVPAHRLLLGPYQVHVDRKSVV